MGAASYSQALRWAALLLALVVALAPGRSHAYRSEGGPPPSAVEPENRVRGSSESAGAAVGGRLVRIRVAVWLWRPRGPEPRLVVENVEYVLDDKHVLNELDGSQAAHPSTRRYHYGNKALAVAEATGTSFILNDALGSAGDFWSSTGVLKKARQYDAWGGFRNGTAPSASEPKLSFTGHQYDPETGWVYAKARYYDSGLGEWLSRDSYEGEIANAPSLNRFAYAEENPLRYWDPEGYKVTTEFIKVLKTEEARQESEYGELVKTQGRDSPFARNALGRLNQLRSDIQDREGENDFEDNVATPVVQEVDMMLIGGGVGGVLAKNVVGRFVLRLAAGAGGAKGALDIKEGYDNDDPWKMVQGTSELVLSGAAMASLGKKLDEDTKEVVEGLKGAGKVVRRWLTPSGVATAPAGALPGGGTMPVPSASPEPIAAKPMQMAKPTSGGASVDPQEGRYEFPDQKAGGTPYVGQSGNIPRRLKTHAKAGRLTPGTETTVGVPGGKTAREIAEHKRIQELTGGKPAKASPSVSNKVDPIGPKRQHLLKDPPP
ncbi:MAG: RHS repeat-associated core domain-containing protein [Deltaproteobacteria bacterium]|nr:RHS repeat-associated core domain-containing protein [Deltaproteobacteria bacterium]